ncbi:MAG: HAMP domain-containing protein [Chloroflexi bacterium]|nr:HAMP domain-containing protein [Chloroflexota bacterium]
MPKTRSLAWKLTLAFLSVAVTVALLVAVFIRLSNTEQLNRLIVEQQRGELEDRLVTYYQANGSWDGVRNYLEAARGEAAPLSTPQPGYDSGPEPGPHPGSWRDRRELFGLVDAQRTVIVPLYPEFPTGKQVSDGSLAKGEPVEVDGNVVGTILTASFPPGLNPEEAAYLQRTNMALLLASGGAVLVALIVGLLLARTLTRPLRALTQAAHRMAGGELEQEVPVKSSDELGELAAAFNKMSREVARANRSRRQMTADVAHELRTPLTVIAGYVESMRDGALAPTPERLSVIYAEIEHLQLLVGDLRTLSQADAGELKLNKQTLAVPEVLQQAQAAFEHQARQKGIRLELQMSGGLPTIQADEARMVQVLGNLISNALRYTPGEGRIVLGAALRGGGVALTVQDTGPGIAPEDLPFVFNRFYRADKSRAEENGESGLGLAIAKAIVEAHAGTIEARSVVGQGTTMAIFIPANEAVTTQA